MERSKLLPYVLVVSLCLAGPLQTVRAGIGYTGNVYPANPNTWDASTVVCVAETANGTLTVTPATNLYSGYSLDNLQVWYYDGPSWTNYGANDLIYDGTYADFTVTGFSGYAVLSAVPEPGTLVMLLAAALCLLANARRKLGGIVGGRLP